LWSRTRKQSSRRSRLNRRSSLPTHESLKDWVHLIGRDIIHYFRSGTSNPLQIRYPAHRAGYISSSINTVQEASKPTGTPGSGTATNEVGNIKDPTSHLVQKRLSLLLLYHPLETTSTRTRLKILIILAQSLGNP